MVMNRFEGIGRLAADPEQRSSQTGMMIANFTVCCDSGYGDKKKTEFVRCTAFDKLAGPMDTQKWQDKENITRYSTGIIVNEMKMLSSKTDSAGRNESPRENFDHPGSTGPDVPF